VPGWTSPGRLDKKMCRLSVDPMPSMISTPKRSVNRCCSGAGSGSPADTARRTDANASSGRSLATRWAKKVGTPQKIVGLSWLIRPAMT